MFRCTRGRQNPIHDSETLSYIHNSNKPGTKTNFFRIDTAPHGVETPTPLIFEILVGAHAAKDERTVDDSLW